jgi:hypothetical protein
LDLYYRTRIKNNKKRWYKTIYDLEYEENENSMFDYACKELGYGNIHNYVKELKKIYIYYFRI